MFDQRLRSWNGVRQITEVYKLKLFFASLTAKPSQEVIWLEVPDDVPAIRQDRGILDKCTAEECMSCHEFSMGRFFTGHRKFLLRRLDFSVS